MSRLTLAGTPRQYSGHYDIYRSLKAFVKRQPGCSLNSAAYNMQRRPSLLSHLSLAVCPVAGVFNLDYPSLPLPPRPIPF